MALFDPIRQKWVADNPEERVRQRTILWLLEVGGFSPHEILVERELTNSLCFQNFQRQGAFQQKRRFDIGCIQLLSTHALSWLLLIECKAKIERVDQLESTQRQVEGYASFLSKPVQKIAIASAKGCWQRESSLLPTEWRSGLPKKSSFENATRT